MKKLHLKCKGLLPSSLLILLHTMLLRSLRLHQENILSPFCSKSKHMYTSLKQLTRPRKKYSYSIYLEFSGNQKHFSYTMGLHISKYYFNSISSCITIALPLFINSVYMVHYVHHFTFNPVVSINL